MSYSKVTKKGQTTIPLMYREKYNLKDGAVIKFIETSDGLLLRPVPDIADSAGALSSHADSRDALSEVLRSRKEDFR